MKTYHTSSALFMHSQAAPLGYKQDGTQVVTETESLIQNIQPTQKDKTILPSENARVVLPTPETFPGDCDVKSYILSNVSYYDGDGSFLRGPTERTKKALARFNKLLAKERENGGVLSVDTETPSTITSHAPGYLLSKEEDVIVGLQAEEPLKRTCKPRGGFGVVKKALEAYGYEPGEKIKFYKTDVTTHNDLTFSIYTDEVSLCCLFRLSCFDVTLHLIPY